MTRVKLTLSCPRALAEQVTELLLESEWVTEGFATVDASGHGADFTEASLRERVRGCIETQLVITVLPATHALSLLNEMRARFHTPQMRWWTEPVTDSGDFA